jgi:phospholipid-binding lipoprotein MlaA
MGLTREREDFGQTLGRWGFESGPYVVLPLLGPSSLRDTGGWLLDRRTTLPALVADSGDSNRLTVLGVVQTRSELLSASRMLEQVALDRYVFVREGYLARRRNQVWDGNPPPEPDDD